jgi:hypothetical protein
MILDIAFRREQAVQAWPSCRGLLVVEELHAKAPLQHCSNANVTVTAASEVLILRQFFMVLVVLADMKNRRRWLCDEMLLSNRTIGTHILDYRVNSDVVHTSVLK